VEELLVFRKGESRSVAAFETVVESVG